MKSPTRFERRDGEKKVLNELGIGLVAFSPLGRGLLTSAVRSLDDLSADDARRGLPRFQPNAFTRNRTLVERVEAIAESRGRSVAQVALAWVLAQSVVPIPGTGNAPGLTKKSTPQPLS